MPGKKSNINSIPLKILVMGDEDAGKTIFTHMYKEGKPYEIYTPTFIEKFLTIVVLDSKIYELTVLDASGVNIDSYHSLRRSYYSDTNVCIALFSVTDPFSFKRVLEQWTPEMRNYCSGSSIIVVGTKTGLRNEPEVVKKLAEQDLHPVTAKLGETLALNEPYADVKYFECFCMDSKSGEKVKNIFEDAAKNFSRKNVHVEKEIGL